MNKKHKTAIKLVLALLMVFSMSTTALAQGLEETEKVVDGSALTNEPVSEVDFQNPLRGNILDQGTTRISKVSSGVVNVYGMALCSVVSDKIILKMTLQRYSDGYWINLQTFSDTVTNQSMLAKSYNVSVTKGYHYRVKTLCVAQKNGVTESKMPVTNGIWVD